MAWLASPRLPRHAPLLDDGDPIPRNDAPPQKKTADADHQDLDPLVYPGSPAHFAFRLAERRINPRLRHRTVMLEARHQAAARRAHLRTKMQL